MTYKNDIMYLCYYITLLSSSVNLEQENKLLYRAFLVMESIMKEIDIAVEPYCEEEIVWNFSSVCWIVSYKCYKSKESWY